MTLEADRFYMGLALDLARKGLGRTSPNPAVGCVVARGGRVVGRGFHAAAGTPHAEVHALEQAGEQAAGADVYVSLEPCAHHGRTPPCAELLARSGVKRVVAATGDPNPAVAGRGLDILRSAGIRVQVGLLQAEALRINEAFFLSIREQRAFVHLKLAATLDGKIATRTGDSRWISSDESRRRVHELRDVCGAVAVGATTAATDDPRLTVRLPGRRERRMLRFILDPTLRIPLNLHILSPAEAPFTVVVCAEGADPERAAGLERKGAEVLRVPRTVGGLDLGSVLENAYGRGVMEVLVEGGAETARGFLDQGLVDRAHLFLSPRILGGRDAIPLVGGVSPERVDQALDLEGVEVDRVGPDLYVTGTIKKKR